MSRATRYIAPIVGLVVFFAAWELLVRAFDIRPFVLTRPSQIVRYMLRFPRDYFRAALITMKHAALGFAIAVVVALVIGAAMAASRFIEYATQPVLTLIAVTPFAASWLFSVSAPTFFWNVSNAWATFVLSTVMPLSAAYWSASRNRIIAPKENRLQAASCVSVAPSV